MRRRVSVPGLATASCGADAPRQEEEEGDEKIDPSAILGGGRRTRGVKVDYTSAEAMAKAGLKPEDDADDGEESFSKD
jgi:hypothetical protein